MAKRPATAGALLGLGAAVSFGVSTPISMGLLDSVLSDVHHRHDH